MHASEMIVDFLVVSFLETTAKVCIYSSEMLQSSHRTLKHSLLIKTV